MGFSKTIEMSTKITPGTKDSRLLRPAGGPYARMVGIASQMNVVLYDVKDQRGWLVDGASALLHLSRAALTSRHAPALETGLSSAPVAQFVHVDADPNHRATAKEVLLNKQNRKITLYENEDQPSDSWRFEDLVLEMWGMIDEMGSHQAKLRTPDHRKWELSNPFSTRLEGFGFNDIIAGKNCLRPRYAKLASSGGNWLRFTTESGAINILGSCFGELIRSRSSCCKTCIEVPCGADFLAAPTARLLSIAEEMGEVSSDCLKLVHGVYWDDTHKSFGSVPCACLKKSSTSTCGKQITELQGNRRTKFKGKKPAAEENIFETCPSAAIIVGLQAASQRPSLSPSSTSSSPPVSRITSRGSDSGVDMRSSVSSSS